MQYFLWQDHIAARCESRPNQNPSAKRHTITEYEEIGVVIPGYNKLPR